MKKIGVREIRQLYTNGDPIVALTAYDSLFGRLADRAGVHLILVGDSLGMTTLGYKTTIPVTLEQSLHHTAAVVRGVDNAMIVGDMPFLTFQITPEDALRNAGRFLQEAGADAVKLEGGAKIATTIQRLVAAGIPVLGHVGILPQEVLAQGGYRVRGRSEEDAESLVKDAKAVEAAGAFAIVLEGLPSALSTLITQELNIPTIGIGAGPGCSGQVQVIHDILGLFEKFKPKHAKQYAHLAETIGQALAEYVDDVQQHRFPTEEQSFS